MPEIFGLAFIGLDPRIHGNPGCRVNLQLS